MTDQPTKNTHFPWEAMQGYPVVLLVMAFVPGTLGREGTLTTTFLLILMSGGLISCGILPLYLEGRTPPISIAAVIIIALGSGIGGLGIATILKALFSDTHTFLTDNWVSGVASILANLAVLVWAFVILSIAPMSRRLLIGTISLLLAGGYSLGCGIFFVAGSIVYSADQIAPMWNRGIPAVLNGGAVVIWTLLITRKTIQEKVRFVVPIIIISGVGLMGLGVWWIGSSIFP